MRILMTADTGSGVWTYALELASALGPRDIDVTIAAMGAPATAAQRRRAADLPNARLCEAPYKLEWMDDPWLDVARSARWLLALEAELSPDVVHLNTYAHGAIGFRAPVVMVFHGCMLSRWRAVQSVEAPPAWATYAARVAEGLAGAELLVAPTRAMLDEAISIYDIRTPTRVIAHGVAPRTVPRAAPEPFVLASGRLWDEAHNLTAIEAASEGLTWPVYLAGAESPPCGGRLETRCATLGRLPREGLRHWMARASIYARPARYEAFGLSVLEAALEGCALVLGDIPSLRELWDGAARFVPEGDDRTLRRALRALIRDGEARRALAARAAHRAAGLDAASMAAAYQNAYRELAVARRHREGRAG